MLLASAPGEVEHVGTGRKRIICGSLNISHRGIEVDRAHCGSRVSCVYHVIARLSANVDSLCTFHLKGFPQFLMVSGPKGAFVDKKITASYYLGLLFMPYHGDSSSKAAAWVSKSSMLSQQVQSVISTH